jgi:hypothetical protein
MNLQQLRSRFRIIAKDRKLPYLWSDEELNIYANEAEREAARRSLILFDVNSVLTTVAIVAGTHTYSVSPKILRIERAKLDSMTYPLTVRTRWQMDDCFNNWEGDLQQQQPHTVIQRYEKDKLRLYPVPNAVDSLKLAVRRLPSVDMTANDDVPEIPDIGNYHEALVSHMLAEAHLVLVRENQAPEFVKLHQERFANVFGNPRSALSESWDREYHGADIRNGEFA